MILAVTPQPMPTESLIGYIFRLADANFYPKPSWLWTRSRPAVAFYATTFNVDTLVELTGISRESAARLTLFDPDRSEGTWLTLLGNELPGHMLITACTQVCSGCLREGAVHEAYFQLNFVTYCAIHRRRLLRKCPECSKPLKAERHKFGHCSCGFELAKFDDGVRCSQREADFLHVLRRSLVGPSAGLPMPVAFGHLSELDFSQLLRLMSAVASWQRGTEEILRSNIYDPDWFSRLAYVFSNWPNNILEYLEERYTQPWLLKAHERFSKLKLRKAANDLAARFSNDGHAVSHVFLQLLHFASQYVDCEKLSRSWVYGGVNPDWADVYTCAQLLGIEPEAVAAIARPRCAGPRTNRCLGAEHTDVYYLPRLGIVSNEGELLTLSRVSKLLDLPMAVVKALRDEGILERPKAADLHKLILLSSMQRVRPIVKELGDLRYSRDEEGFSYHITWVRKFSSELIQAFIKEVRTRLVHGHDV